MNLSEAPMAKKQSFLIGSDYYTTQNINGKIEVHHRYITHCVLPVSSYSHIRNKIEQLGATSNYNDIESLLQTPFISAEKSHYQVVVENPNPNVTQIDTFAVHEVSTVLEEFLNNHMDDFKKIIALMQRKCAKISLDLTNLDLNAVNFSGFDLSNATLNHCNLKHNTTITQDMLDTSLGYRDAILPDGFIPIWSKEKRSAVLLGIHKLGNYGEQLLRSLDRAANSKGMLAIKLADDLRTKLILTTNYNGAFQKDFLSTLHRNDEAFNHKRFLGLKMIIGNIAYCILGLGVGYIIAGWLRYKETKRLFFFDRTETQENIAGIDELIKLQKSDINLPTSCIV